MSTERTVRLLWDVLAHRCDTIDDERLWLVITDEIPRLEATAKAALARINQERA